MGRGRQKAKHTKVARELKYFSPDTNYSALERELSHPSDGEPDYSKWIDEDEDESELDGVTVVNPELLDTDEPRQKRA
ncbi:MULTISPECIES: DUF3073 domain-containing protein [unclassified Agreia]|uniref:DUF3073 domain-containing protein n=1 Tax=unclassified Agreia TaxID=2641148 RepID=UPI0006FBB1B4|nr:MULTISPECIES: DUF3073 domain-containing protein [Microbacteriaceae]KQM59366.1 hypothetical protein ASE64_08305 [Agreia sp. Leaf210]KQR20335.1 hypothetical protein ASF79_12400 [Agreia sp. Leaf335]PPF62609.1 DUF3073 domain-containing protein [Clavibacter michiganensis]